MKTLQAASRRDAEARRKVKNVFSPSPGLSLKGQGFLRNHNVQDLLSVIKVGFDPRQEILNYSGEGEVIKD